jgi:Cyclic nucleotide-binding domain/Ion channel
MRIDSYRLYQLWDVLIAVSVTYAVIEIPLRLVLRYTPSMQLMAFEGMITLILGLDVVVQWQRHPEPVGRLTGSLPPRSVLPKVLWRGIDLVAAVPFNLFSGATILPLLRLVKLARVAQRMQQWGQHEVQRANLLRLTFFVYWMLLIAHCLACGWLALDGRTQLGSETAAPAYGSTRYLRSLYWSITTLATIGYGDITPTENAQIVYTMIVMLLGVGIYGYVIGNITSLLANIDLAKSHYRENMERLGAFMRYRNIPPMLQRRLRDYYAYLWENRLGYDESTVLADLPDSLRTEVALFLRRDFIERAPLFQGASHELVREMALQLRPVVFTPGDFIFRAGQYGYNMYFISRGTVEIIAPDGTTVLTKLTDGQFFGELALLFSQPRTASVRAVDYCDLYTLDKDTFDHVLTRYPEFAAHIKVVADERSPQTTQA